ncbi:MAG: dihydropteroate synthase [Bacteroidota bacterium]
MPFDHFFSKNYTVNYKGSLQSINQPLVMGILNIGEDSFFDGGKHNSINLALKQTEKMLNEGADIIDIGATSSKPSSKLINASIELKSIIPYINQIVKEFKNINLSIDTYNSKVAFEAVQHGTNIINDISAGEFDKEMFSTIAKLKVPYIMMHTKGTPENMQFNPSYNNVTTDVMYYFSKKINELHQLGATDLIIDPGFGFGKTLEHNYELLNNLEFFTRLNKPLLVGISRKSMIYKLLNTSPDDALTGTITLNTIALIKGANILRVHDVKEATQVIELIKTINCK